MICNINSTFFNINDFNHKKEIDIILGSIRNKLSKKENVSYEDVKSMILKTFEEKNGLGLSFSLNPNISSEIDTYNKSIDDFIDVFCEQLKSKNKENSLLYNNPRKGRIEKIPVLTSNDINEIKKELNTKLKAKSLLNIEKHIQDKISETEFVKGSMIRLGEMYSEEYKDIQELIFSDNQLANQNRLDDFKKQLIGFTIINNKGKGYIIDSNYFINKSIINYLNEQYKILYEFLKSINLIDDSMKISKNLYYQEKLVLNHKDLLLVMQNYLNSTKFDRNTLNQDWLKFIANPNDNSINLYSAVNAYLSIMHFDDIIKEVFDGFISINENSSAIIDSRTDANNQTQTVLKYSLLSKNTNQINHWGDNDENSLKILSNYVNILVSSIPIVNHITKKAQTEVLQPKDLFGSVAKLLEIGHLIKYDELHDGILNDLRELILTIQDDTPRKFKKILEILFSGKANRITYVQSYLRTNHNIDQTALTYLYSFYQTVFKGTGETNSWYNIENNYIRENGILSRYNTVDSLCYALTSNVSVNYLQSKYDFEERETKTTIKPKFNIDSRVFDIRNHINKQTIDRNNKKELIETYLPDHNKIKFKKSFNVVLVKIGNKEYTIEFDKKGVFDKMGNIVSITNSSNKEMFSIDSTKQSFAKIFKKFDFSEIQHYFRNKEELISIIDTYSSESESKYHKSDFELLLDFINIVQFIDDILGFRFSKTDEGLEELQSFLFNNSQTAQNFKNMFGSAVRSLLISKIYYDFESLKDENGKNVFSRRQFIEFLEQYIDNDLLEQGLIGDWVGFNLNDKNLKRRYTFERIDGTHLTSVTSGESQIKALGRTRAELEGDTSKSVIKNFSNDNIPNLSQSFLGAKIETQIYKQDSTAASNLLFHSKLKNIVSKCVDTDVMSFTGQKKQIKDLTYSDLLYNSIVNNFIVPLNSGTVCYFQPTVYSDKTKIVVYGIELQGLLNNDAFKKMDLFTNSFNNVIEHKMIETIGKSYEQIWNNVVEDYKKIFYKESDFFNSDRTLNISKVQNWLKTHTLKDLQAKVNDYNNTFRKNLTIYQDVHYRKINKGLSINELLWEYSQNLYTPEVLHHRLEREKINFINELLGLRFKIQVDIDDSGNLDTAAGNETTKLLGRIAGHNNNPWVDNKRMILGKIHKVDKNGKKISTRNIIYGRVSLGENEVFELNPILNAYFMLDNLVGNNLRLSLTGSEINHKIKPITKDLGEFVVETKKDEISGEVKEISLNSYRNMISELNPDYTLGSLITFYDLDQAIKSYNSLPDVLPDGVKKSEKYNIKPLIKAYEQQIYLMENAAQNAQFKRNVTIPGTIRHYSNNELNNIGKEMKVAVIEDIGANVFNFDGVTDKIDAHDGSAWVNPFWSILENYSLQDNEVGTVKKPIHHYYDGKFVGATLLKYAVNTITNRLMLRSEGNSSDQIRMKDIFKKMTNQKWDPTVIDLTQLGLKSEKSISDFNKIILEGDRLFYKDEDKHYEIISFDKDEDSEFYYTEEQQVDYAGNSLGKDSYIVFHLFDSNSNHIKVSEDQLEQLITSGQISKYHTVQSLYELHTVMGGIYSESLDSQGNLQYSEKSNYAVVQFMNNVVQIKDEGKTELNQDNYYQPLKYLAIDMVANQTAVKNGAGNINPSSSFYNDEPLTYMVLNTDFYGIQMNSDHEADEAHMTEFSQVISSLDAQGYLHKYVREIYDSLGSVALQLAKVELEAVEEYRKNNDISKLYDVVARTIINNLKRNKGESGLAQEVMATIERELNLNTNHKKDKHHVPFSDKTIYSTILSTFVSVLNKKSIKRQYPGLGTVICPGYDIATVHELNIDGKNQVLMYEDLVRLAYGYFREKNDLSILEGITDVALKNRTIVQEFLYEKQKEMPVITLNDLDPTDNVFIRLKNSERFLIENLDTNLVDYKITQHEWIDDQGNKHYNPVLKIFLKGQEHKGSFDLVKDMEHGFYSVHFKTGNADTGEIYGSTAEERNILYENLYNAIPYGAKVSTYGYVSEGGVRALDKLMSTYIGDLKYDNTLKDDFGNVIQRDVKDREGNDIKIPIYVKTSVMDDDAYHSDFELHVSLAKIDDYYNFKQDIRGYLLQKGYIVNNIDNIILQKDVTKPRNLAPQKLRFSYYDGEKWTSINIFDHWRLQKLYNESKKIKSNKKFSKSEKSRLLKELYQTCNPQQAFLELSSQNPEYILEDGTKFEVSKESIINIPAEIIMANIYRSRFQIGNGITLNQILKTGEAYFRTNQKLIESDNYDMAFTKFEGKHLYVTFKPLNTDSDNIDSSKRKWKIIPEDFEYPEDYNGERNIIQSIYAITKDNIKLFEVGRKIIAKNVRYDHKLKRYVQEVENENGEKTVKILKNQGNYSQYTTNENKTIVLEYVEFLSKYEVSEYGDVNEKYTLYNINKKNLEKASYKRDYTEEELRKISEKRGRSKDNLITKKQKQEEDISYFISGLLSDIYKSDDFSGVQFNKQLSETSHFIINNSLYNFAEKLSYNPALSKYLHEVKTKINNLEKDKETGKYNYKLGIALRKYSNDVAQNKYSSFLKSLYFTASRIPAQTLQSFMQMGCVGFTGTNDNHCYVSHWQTWLQGSDY